MVLADTYEHHCLYILAKVLSLHVSWSAGPHFTSALILTLTSASARSADLLLTIVFALLGFPER